jgi:hypothetical protein
MMTNTKILAVVRISSSLSNRRFSNYFATFGNGSNEKSFIPTINGLPLVYSPTVANEYLQ